MKIWLDDERPAPPGWTWCYNCDAAIKLLEDSPYIEHISFDHDLGMEGTSRPLALKILQRAINGTYQPPRWTVHSANPVGVEWLTSTLESADRHYRHAYTRWLLQQSHQRRK